MTRIGRAITRFASPDAVGFPHRPLYWIESVFSAIARAQPVFPMVETVPASFLRLHGAVARLRRSAVD
jgi:hypothetical protein